MSISDDSAITLASNQSILIPVSSDKTPLSWKGNDAVILGTLHEIGRYYRNKGLFQMLFQHRAVILSNGRLAIEDINSVPFVTGAAADPKSFDDLCPPTPERVHDYNSDIDLGTRAGTKLKPLPAIPDEHKGTLVLAKHSVDQEDARLLHSLSFVFGHAEQSEALLEAADGSGLKLLVLLRARGRAADPRDKALVATQFAGIVRDGVRGELTLDTFTAFLKRYKSARRNIAPASRPSDEAEVEMISVIAIKDPATRELYELKTTAKPPTDLDQASDALLAMLRGRVRCEEIDQATSGAKDLALAATGGTAVQQPAVAASVAADVAAPVAALLASGMKLTPEQLTALVSALAPPDPRKAAAGKVTVPRGADGKPSKWVEGMAKCRCGVGGGKHLFRECPKAAAAKAEKERKAKEKALAAELAAAGDAAVPVAISQDELRSALAALLSGPE